MDFEYDAKEDDELTMNVGDIITNVVRVSDGWSEGTLNGKRGMFPDNFVKVRYNVCNCCIYSSAIFCQN